MSGTVLEDKIAGEFKRQDYIVFTRKTIANVGAVKPDIASPIWLNVRIMNSQLNSNVWLCESLIVTMYLR